MLKLRHRIVAPCRRDPARRDVPGRIRLSSAASLHAFIKTDLAPGVTAKTDGWPVYPGAPGIDHYPHVIGKMAAHVIPPWTHRVFSNLKVWALGVYHVLRRNHLQTYVGSSSAASIAAAPGTPSFAP